MTIFPAVGFLSLRFLGFESYSVRATTSLVWGAFSHGLNLNTSSLPIIHFYKDPDKMFYTYFLYQYTLYGGFLPKPSHGWQFFSHWYLYRNRYNVCQVWNMLWKVPQKNTFCIKYWRGYPQAEIVETTFRSQFRLRF